MKITVHRIDAKAVAIAAFADQHNLEMDVKEREPEELLDSRFSRYYASFRNTEVKEGNLRTGTVGNGNTIKAAIRNYAEKIQGRVLVISLGSSKGHLITVPKKLHCNGIEVE